MIDIFILDEVLGWLMIFVSLGIVDLFILYIVCLVILDYDNKIKY